MPCKLWSVFVCGAGLLSFAGCAAHRLETRAITAFIESLEKSDIDELKANTSDDFKQTALRHKEAVDAFKMLNLPAGKVEVLDVKDKEDGGKRVLVEVGERKRRLYCDLIFNEETKKWVIDDIEVKRKLRPGEVKKTISQQMDMLLSLEEILDAWESGNRSQVLALCSPDLKGNLEPLPEPAMKRFIRQIAKDLKREGMKPEIEGHANTALATLKRKSGELKIKLQLCDGKWLAEDIAVISRREEESMSSLRKHALVMLTAIQFCDAYQKSDKVELERVCLSKFYRLNLDSSDLKRVPLPALDPGSDSYDIRIIANRGEVVLKQPEQVIQISLTQGLLKLDEQGETVEEEANGYKPFLVEEVTLHSLESGEDKRLSALFSSQSIVQLFAQALSEHDLKVVQLSATNDFNSRVWRRIELSQLGLLPLNEFDSGTLKIIDTRFRGPLTEITVDQGETPLTYVLRDQNGKFLVDDILIPALDRPNSLKQNLEVIIPLRFFTEGLKHRDVKQLQATASREFNKLVFQSMDHLPNLKIEPSQFLDQNVNRIELTSDRALLVLGDDQHGAKVFMTREDERFTVDDVVLIGGQEVGQRSGLKLMFRQIVVTGTQFGSQMTKTTEEESETVEQVDYEELAPTTLPRPRSTRMRSKLRISPLP